MDTHRQKSQEILNTYFSTNQAELGRLIIEGNNIVYRQDFEKLSTLQKLLGGTSSDLNLLATFCIKHEIPSQPLEEAIQNYNDSCKLWGKIPQEVLLTLQRIRFRSMFLGNSFDLLTQCQEATKMNCDAVLKNLLQTNQLNSRDLDALLFIASQNGAAWSVKTLLEMGANPNSQDEAHNNWTPLLYAVESGNLATCRELLRHGANVDLGHAGFSPLMLACQKGNTEMVRLLVKHNANLLQQNMGEAKSALAWACETGNVGVVKELIKHSPKRQLSMRDARTMTPLDIAQARGYTEIVALLNK